MKILMFRFIMTIKCLSHNKLLNYIVIISITIGLFYSCVLLGSINYNLHNMKIAKSLENQNFILAEPSMVAADEEKIISNLKREIKDIQEVGVSASLIRVPASVGSTNELINLQGLDNVVMNMTDWLVQGRVLTKTELEKGEPVALVHIGFMQKHGLRLGDTVVAYGKELKIIGSVLSGNLVGNLFVPYKILKDVSINNNIQYQLFILGNRLKNDDIKNAFKRYYPNADMINLRNSGEIVSSNKAAFNMVMGISGLHNLITLALSIASTTIIVSGRLINNRKNIAIKLSHGSSVKNIATDSVLETFIFSLIAITIDLILIYLFRRILSNIVTVLFSWHLILYCLILAGLFSLLVGLISGIAATYFNVSNMLRV